MTVSVICAVVIWFIIALTVYTSTPVDFYNIPLEVDLSGTTAGANGLSVVSCDVESVNVQLVGERSQVGRLKEENLTAYAVLDSVNSAGEYTLDIDVQSDMNISFTVDDIIPAQATVKLDKIETREFDVEAGFPNVVVTSGHALDREAVTIEPATIEITGPSAQLDEIGRVVAQSDRSMEIDSTYSLYTSDLKLYTKEGAVLDTEGMELPNTDFQISIPVLTTKELTLTCDLLGFPKDFDEEWFMPHLTFTPETITLASQTSTAFADRDAWSVGQVRLSEIGLDYSRSFDIELDEEFTNRTNVWQATMTLDSEDLATRTFTVGSNNIIVTNPPSGYDFKVVTQQLNITVVGEKEALETLEADDIVVTADLFNYENAEQASSFDQPALVSFLDQNRVWAYGSYRISLDRVEKPTEETESTTN